MTENNEQPKKTTSAHAKAPTTAPKTPKRKKLKKRTIFARVCAVIGVTLLMAVVFLFSVLCIINYGPSARAHKLFVNSVRETSALKFLAEWFTTDEELKQILAENSIEIIEEVTNTDLIEIGTTPTEAPKEPEKTEAPVDVTPTEKPEGLASDGNVYKDLMIDEDGIIVVGVKGTTYVGRMMIVLDPKRVITGVCDAINNPGGRGMRLDKIIAKYDAVAGVNAGGFLDVNGQGTGSVPLGHVYSQGKFISGGDTSQTFVGFNKDNVLIVGNMTTAQAKQYNIRDAVSFGPALIVNGVSANRNGVSSGLNPRTAIGQRKDGAVLILVIDGRQANSLGASYGDLIDVFEQFGAVNAANLDGGSSSLMIYKGEVISSKSNIISDRPLPTTFIVTK